VSRRMYRHSGARVKRASPESITTIVSMDSGPAPSGASRNDIEFCRCASLGRDDESYLLTPISRKYFITPGWINSWLGAAAIVFATVVSQACASFQQNAASMPCSVRASR
jgi:hypothetical protein